MALYQCLIDITCPTSSGTTGPYTCTDIATGQTFQPKALIAFGAAGTATGQTAGASMMLGFWAAASGTAQMTLNGFGGRNNDKAATEDDSQWQANGYFIDQIAITGSGTGAGAFCQVTSVGSTSFSLNWGGAGAGTAFKITVLALGGSDLTGAEIVTFQMPASNGSQTVTTTLGTPNTIFFLGSNYTSAGVNGPTASGFTNIFGWAIGSSLACGCATFGMNGVAGTIYGLLCGDALNYPDYAAPTGSNSGVANLSSVANNQFVMGWTNTDAENASGSQIRFLTSALVLYGTFQAATFANASPTSTGTQTNSLAFTPECAIVQSVGLVNGSAFAATSSYSIGAYDGSNNRAHNVAIVPGTSTLFSTEYSTYETGEALEIYTATTGGSTSDLTHQVEASLAISGGVNAVFTTVNASVQYEYIGIALGSAPAAPAIPARCNVIMARKVEGWDVQTF